MSDNLCCFINPEIHCTICGYTICRSCYDVILKKTRKVGGDCTQLNYTLYHESANRCPKGANAWVDINSTVVYIKKPI